MTTFLRVLEADPAQKGPTLRNAVGAWSAGFTPAGIFEVDASSFEQVPGSPFAYWVSERVRRLFTDLPAFEGDGRTAKQGLATADDFRFVRAWWEVEGRSGWESYAKGGNSDPFYAELPMVVWWADDGREVKSWVSKDGDHWSRRVSGSDLYFQPGITWALRTSRFAPQCLPEGSIISVSRYGAFAPRDQLACTVALGSSVLLDSLFKLSLDWVTRPKYVVGTLQSLPWVQTADPRLASLALSGWQAVRRESSWRHSSRAFDLPALLQTKYGALSTRIAAVRGTLLAIHAEISHVQSEIDDVAFGLYGIGDEDRRQMEAGFASLTAADQDSVSGPEEDDGDEVSGTDPVALTESLIEWTLGVALGRFDVRLATGERQPPPDPDPFDRLPVCSPGMLQDGKGLPATKPPVGYPLELPPDGILVDDPGHPWDVVRRIEAVFDLIVGENAHDWITEAETILGRDLRDWVRRQAFEGHLKRYSRSRRKAPLFWHLAPKSREYGVWLYSPVATRDSLYRVLNDYVDPRLRVAERRLLEVRQEGGDSPTAQQRREIASQEALVTDLRGFREELARVAPLWNPHRDDGVVLNCAVLHRLFDHHRAWQKECRSKWGEMAKGKYDWAGWAMHLWPERVVRACASDRSIAISHGLEEALWEEDEDGKWRPRKDGEEQVERLIEARRSPAIEAALDEFTRTG